MVRKQATILDVKIDSTSYDGVLRFVSDKLAKKEKFYIVTPNPEIILKASTDRNLQDILNNADLSIPDGVGLLWVQRLTKGTTLSRLPGRIVMTKLLEVANDKGLTVYFLGSRKKVIEKTLKKAAKSFPHLKAYGDSGPLLNNEGLPDSKDSINIQSDVIDYVNKVKPDLLFVAFGAPKQEKWIAKNLDKLNIGGAMTVGGTLDTFSEVIKPSPIWVTRIGLEWAWRLLQEPRRIGRIFNAVVVFPIKVILQVLK